MFDEWTQQWTLKSLNCNKIWNIVSASHISENKHSNGIKYIYVAFLYNDTQDWNKKYLCEKYKQLRVRVIIIKHVHTLFQIIAQKWKQTVWEQFISLIEVHVHMH